MYHELVRLGAGTVTAKSLNFTTRLEGTRLNTSLLLYISMQSLIDQGILSSVNIPSIKNWKKKFYWSLMICEEVSVTWPRAPGTRHQAPISMIYWILVQYHDINHLLCSGFPGSLDRKLSMVICLELFIASSLL